MQSPDVHCGDLVFFFETSYGAAPNLFRAKVERVTPSGQIVARTAGGRELRFKDSRVIGPRDRFTHIEVVSQERFEELRRLYMPVVARSKVASLARKMPAFLVSQSDLKYLTTAQVEEARAWLRQLGFLEWRSKQAQDIVALGFELSTAAYTRGLEDAAKVADEHYARAPNAWRRDQDRERGWEDASDAIAAAIRALKPVHDELKQGKAEAHSGT